MNPKHLQRLQRQRNKLTEQIGKVGPFIRGSVVLLRRPCTHPNCRKCRSGEKHPGLYLSVSTKGKTRLFYLPKAIQDKAKRWSENYRRLQGLLEGLHEINRKLLLAEAKRRKNR